MTLIQMASLAGGLFALGCVALAWQLLPADPDLGSVLERLSPERTLVQAAQANTRGEEVSRSGQLGLWIMRHAPWMMLGPIPSVDLDLLQIATHRFYAMKVEYTLLGFFSPVLINLLMWLTGSGASITVSVLVSIAIAAGMSMLPNLNITSSAKRARKTFNWALIAYIELVAVERRAGAGPREALERAAGLSDSWVFHRISEELARSRWAGESPWEGLTRLGTRLQLDSLVDFSEVMRLAGEEGANVYEILRSRAASMRTEIVNTDLGNSTAQTQKMALPIAGLFLIFTAMLLIPVLLRATGL